MDSFRLGRGVEEKCDWMDDEEKAWMRGVLLVVLESRPFVPLQHHFERELWPPLQ